jgi:hypothetical protein
MPPRQGILDEYLIFEILQYFPLRRRFCAFQFVSKDFYAAVNKPLFNRKLELDLRDSFNEDLEDPHHTAVAKLLSEDAQFQLLIYERCIGNLRFLFDKKGLWSQISELILVGLKTDSQIIRWVARLDSLESLELIAPEVAAVHDLLDCDQLPQLKSICLRDVEFESLQELDLFGRPALEELILSEIFLIKDYSILSSSIIDLEPLSSQLEDSLLNPSPPPTAILDKLPHVLRRLDLYVIPFPELLGYLKTAFSNYLFPDLNYLKIRCLASSTNADQLASLIDSRVETHGWSALEELEIGIATPKVIRVIEDKCNRSSLKRLAFSSRVDLTRIDVELHSFAAAFPNVSKISFRAKSSSQISEFADLVSRTPWRNSLDKLKISWHIVNSVGVADLVKLRIALGAMRTFIAGSRSLAASRTGIARDGMRNDGFQNFFIEVCKDRIICECEECQASPDESHVVEIATEEWAELDLGLKQSYLTYCS